MTSLIATSGTGILVPPGIALQSVVEGSLPVGQRDVGGLAENEVVDVSFRLEYSHASGAFEIAAFGIDRMKSATQITGALWRTVRVHSIVRTAVELALPSWAQAIPRARFRRRDGVLKDPPHYEPSDPDGLLLAALAYRVAQITNENPALAVAETLGLKQRTATNWIARARDAGYMTSTEHEQAGRRIAQELRERIPLGDRPRTDEEETVFLATIEDSARSRRRLQERRRTERGDD